MQQRVLIAKEELCALSLGYERDDDRTADDAAVLMAVNVVGYGCKVRSGVEVAVAQVLKRVAMELLAARLADDVDDRAGALAVFRVVVAGLNAELLQRVWERERSGDVGHLVRVVAAVQHV